MFLLDEAARRIGQTRRDANVGDALLELLLDGLEERLQLFRGLVVRILLGLLFLLAAELDVPLRDVDELLVYFRLRVGKKSNRVGKWRISSVC